MGGKLVFRGKMRNGGEEEDEQGSKKDSNEGEYEQWLRGRIIKMVKDKRQATP